MNGFKERFAERLGEHLRSGCLTRLDAGEGLAQDFVQKELKEAKTDLHTAIIDFKRKDFKWATTKAYFSVFHSGRAILFALGLREKTHFAVGLVLDELVKEGKLEREYANHFNALKSAREDADYHYEHSRETAKQACEAANAFLLRTKTLLPSIANRKTN